MTTFTGWGGSWGNSWGLIQTKKRSGDGGGKSKGQRRLDAWLAEQRAIKQREDEELILLMGLV